MTLAEGAEENTMAQDLQIMTGYVSLIVYI